jgi:hypothetical protein
MVIKYTSHFLHKLEDLFAESDYMLRYEKGNFKSGYCVLKDTKMVLVNAYYPLEGKVNCLVDILRNVELSQDKFTDKSRKLLADLLAQDQSEAGNQLSIGRQGVVIEGEMA